MSLAAMISPIYFNVLRYDPSIHYDTKYGIKNILINLAFLKLFLKKYSKNIILLKPKMSLAAMISPIYHNVLRYDPSIHEWPMMLLQKNFLQ